MTTRVKTDVSVDCATLTAANEGSQSMRKISHKHVLVAFLTKDREGLGDSYAMQSIAEIINKRGDEASLDLS